MMMRIADQANRTGMTQTPWLLAKEADTDAAKKTELKRVCTDCLYTFFALSVYLEADSARTIQEGCGVLGSQ